MRIEAERSRENVYVCPDCEGYTVTVDVDEGTTPMFLNCRASGGEGDCPGMAVSSMYPSGPRPAHIPAPAWEWFRLDAAALPAMSLAMQEHVRAGGLEIRRKESSPMEAT